MEKNRLPDKKEKGNINILERFKVLNESQLHAVLSTLGNSGPHLSLVAYAATHDLEGIIFATPKNTRKYKNILKNKNVAFLIDTRSNNEDDYLSAESLTITGTATIVRKGRRYLEMANALLEKHPNLKSFVNSENTRLVFIRISDYTHVTRFQSVSYLKVN
jgi:nitroimidazol reductase NimA-like FMN-containing flavoprotein (pyridoxamine 5'-phosphate oxidase superfamily)